MLIRNKRLARLGGSSNVSSPTASSPATPSVVPGSPSTQPSVNPEHQITSDAAQKYVKPFTPIPHTTQSAPSTVRPAAREKIAPQTSQSLNTTPKLKQIQSVFSYSKWEEDTVENIFGIALD
ncbi:hypothetical protein FRC15_010609, partial [Serendipita sp. 397]